MDKTPAITLETRVARSDRIMSSPVDNALVMMDLEGGKYFSLDPIGAEIWARLAEPMRIGDLCEQLTSKYAVAPDICRHDVLKLLNKMAAEGLVSTST
ncbi:PqqD family protein [Thiohalocapsa marina]|uniref:PqqD family protein n=1 Tax=Thiohalocapsa marina TaxID=424902 RepID=A0A5M8FUC3_9GAMM|nr:PqqD family protein [Thiohalocapsa marina]KAA6187400.1 PqqD family protein [Thiohalocapsa marina]